MMSKLRNITINMATGGVLVCFALIIGVIATVGFNAARMAGESIALLNQINISQLNEISRADALINGARVNLEAAANFIADDRGLQATRRLEEADATLSRAEERFNSFLEAPKSAESQVLAETLENDFRAVVELVREQSQVLKEDNDVEVFGLIRDELVPLNDQLTTSMAAFVSHAEGSVQTELTDYDSQVGTYTWMGLAALAAGIGVMGLVYLGLRTIVINPLKLAVKNLEYIAKTDLSHNIETMGENEIGRLFSAMREMQESLSSIVTDVRHSSDSIHTGASEIASGNADLSSRTEQQAASLEETAASMDELTTTVKQNADNARQASALAQDASTTASHGGEVVEKVISTMRVISDSSGKIADITGLIDSIAFQTNILALNASVEAARAGEQGRGFAVVAGEVRNLAGRSADAAKEIKKLIEDSAEQVKNGSNLVEQAGSTMKDVVAAVKRVTDIIDEISSASQEQSSGIDQVSEAVSQMDKVTQQNAALVQEAASAAASLEDQAKNLEEVVAVFQLAGGVGGSNRIRTNSEAKEKPVFVPTVVKKTKTAEVIAHRPGTGKGGKVAKLSPSQQAAGDNEWKVF
ncbi:MAG: methyl-accepting chemotaxis protein [Pseudomonadales bacterium]|nr:methyl-accepting chemotaxis protein [Pseudomonadales bacterium]